MLDYQEERVTRPVARRPEATGDDAALLERSLGAQRPPAAEEPSQLKPQQHRNAIWRWHVRRRPRRP